MEIKLNTIMPFGKHKGEKVSNLLIDISSKEEFSFIEKDLKYFMWIHRETQHTLGQDVLERIENIFEYKPVFEVPYPPKSYNGYRGDFGQSSCPGDYMGMGPSDFGIPYC